METVIVFFFAVIALFLLFIFIVSAIYSSTRQRGTVSRGRIEKMQGTYIEHLEIHFHNNKVINNTTVSDNRIAHNDHRRIEVSSDRGETNLIDAI